VQGREVYTTKRSEVREEGKKNVIKRNQMMKERKKRVVMNQPKNDDHAS